MSKRTLFPLLAVLLLGGAAFLLFGRTPGLTNADVPVVDASASEPQVAARIARCRAHLLEHGASAARWAQLAQVLHAHDFRTQAVACYREAATLAPRDYRWPYLAGLAQADFDLRAAGEDFKAAAALRPDNAAFYINHGDLLQQLDRVAEATTQFDRALELDPDSSHALHGLARSALSRGDLAQARRLLDRSRTAAPTSAEGHILRSQLLAREGRLDASKQEAERAREAGTPTRAYDPVAFAMEQMAVSSKALARRGASLASAGDFVRAERVFRRVLEIRLGTASDHANLAGALAGQRKTAEAIAHYKQALQIAPDDLELLSNFGLVLANSGDPAGGIELLEKALKLDGTRYQAHHNLGLVRDRQGDAEQAIAHFREALRLQPAASKVSNALGSALARRGRLRDAVQVWSKALEGDPGSLSLRYNLGVARVSQGRHADAIAVLEEGLRQAPRSTRFLGLLAWELATAPDPDLRDGDRALKMARTLFAAAPSKPDVADLLAAALAATARFPEAVRIIEKALAARPAPPAHVAQGLRQRLALYRKDLPFRQP